MRIIRENYAIHNAMEDLADEAVKQVVSEDRTACDCDMCLDDTKSQMLNQLKHLYHPILSEGEKQKSLQLEELDSELFSQVMVACYKAVLTTKENPRHHVDRSPIQNCTETLVLLALSEVLAQENLELRQDELSRVMATTMNQLTPQYTTTLKGDAFSRTVEMDSGYRARLYSAIFTGLKEIPNLHEDAPHSS